MLQKLREKRQDEGGFTLIELLVVVLIIAILAAIAIPIFLKQREKAYQADLESSLRNSATAAESYAAQASPPGDYSGLDGDDGTLLSGEGFRFDAGNQTVVVTAGTDTYCVHIVDARITSGSWVDGGKFDTTAAGEGKPVPAASC